MSARAREAVDNLIAVGNRMAAAIARVRALHAPGDRGSLLEPFCRGCTEIYPCPTIHALDGDDA